MKKYLLLFLLPLLAFSVCSCSDDDDNKDTMLWEVASNTNTGDITILNMTNSTGANPSIVFVTAGKEEGDVVLNCTNHTAYCAAIDEAIAKDGKYYDEEAALTITRENANSLKLHFAVSKKTDKSPSDEILFTFKNTAEGNASCQSFISVTRSYGATEEAED